MISSSSKENVNPMNEGTRSLTWHLETNFSTKPKKSRPKKRVERFPDGKTAWHEMMTNEDFEPKKAPPPKRLRLQEENPEYSNKPLTPEDQLENLLKLPRGEESFPYPSTRLVVQLMLYKYRSLKSKNLNQNKEEYQKFLSLGTRVFDTILSYSLEEIYFNEYVHLLKYLADIGNIVYQTPIDRMRLLVNYKFFHEKMNAFINSSAVLKLDDKVLYFRTCMGILNAALNLTSDLTHQKELLHQIIEENKKIFLVRKQIIRDKDLISLFNSYENFYQLIPDVEGKLKIVDEALEECQKIKTSHSISDEIKILIGQYILKYEEKKRALNEKPLLPDTSFIERQTVNNFTFSYGLLPEPRSSLDTSMYGEQTMEFYERHGAPYNPFLNRQIANIFPPPSPLLPEFKATVDNKMLRMFKIAF